MRLESYPHSAFKKEFTVSTVGVAAVKYLGFTGGNGSGLLICPRSFNFSGAGVVAFCAGAGAAALGAVAPVCAPAVPVVPVCAPAATATLRTDANPANMSFEIFKESFLRRRSTRTASLLHLNLDRNGEPAPRPKRFFCHLQHRRCLLSLVLAALHQL